VNARIKARTWREVVRHLKGGGGTDFVPVFEAAAHMRPRPEVLVFCTDGMGPAPAEPPYPLRVIWLLVGPYKQRPYAYNGPITYGEFIEVDDG
jgi:predicted metal-dependent peptidase